MRSRLFWLVSRRSRGRCTTVRAEDFIISKRPRLGSITKHRKIEFTDYERRLNSMQSILQAVQQAYLGTQERAVIVLEGWDTAGNCRR
jgi:polyphosphate kinase 2 (PPK2 family)